MDLQSALAFAIPGPWIHFKAKINESRIKDLEGVFEAKTVLGCNGGTTSQQVEVQVLIDGVIATRINVTQLRTRDVFQPQMVPGPALYPQSGFHVTQTLFARSLGIEIHNQLIPGRKMLGVAIGTTLFYFMVKLTGRNKINQLPENCARICHGRSPFGKVWSSKNLILTKKEAGLYTFIFFRTVVSGDVQFGQVFVLSEISEYRKC